MPFSCYFNFKKDHPELYRDSIKLRNKIRHIPVFDGDGRTFQATLTDVGTYHIGLPNGDHCWNSYRVLVFEPIETTRDGRRLITGINIVEGYTDDDIV